MNSKLKLSICQVDLVSREEGGVCEEEPGDGRQEQEPGHWGAGGGGGVLSGGGLRRLQVSVSLLTLGIFLR